MRRKRQFFSLEINYVDFHISFVKNWFSRFKTETTSFWILNYATWRMAHWLKWNKVYSAYMYFELAKIFNQLSEQKAAKLQSSN